jgi:hypothetical protein
MEDGSQKADEEAYKEAEELLKANGVAGKMVARMIRGLKAKGRQGGQLVDALVIMGEATKQSQLAEKAYWDYSKNGVKTNADYDRAEEILTRAIRNLDRTMNVFPTTVGALLPVKKKLMIQNLDIQHQRKGEVLDPAELEREYEASLKAAPDLERVGA